MDGNGKRRDLRMVHIKNNLKKSVMKLATKSVECFLVNQEIIMTIMLDNGLRIACEESLGGSGNKKDSKMVHTENSLKKMKMRQATKNAESS